jgi:phosphatidylglycerophosphate synthase
MLYIPNLIGTHALPTLLLNHIRFLQGYGRIIFAFLAFACADDPRLFFVFYSISAWADIADGHFARLYNQSEWQVVVCRQLLTACARV